MKKCCSLQSEAYLDNRCNLEGSNTLFYVNHTMTTFCVSASVYWRVYVELFEAVYVCVFVVLYRWHYEHRHT